MARQEMIDLICRKADQWGIDRVEFLGGAIAESNLDPHARRPLDPAQDTAYWPDVSFGLFQQTAKFADEGDHSPRADNIRFIQELYSDPEHACDVAAKKYLYWRHDPDVPALTAWVAYNSPGYYRTPGASPNRANYERGLSEAAAIVAALPQEPEMPNAPRLRTVDAGVRLRDKPTTDGAILATLPLGALVERRDRAWRPVRYQGQDGWMADDYLEDAPDEEPPPAPPSLTFNPDFPLRLQVQDFACSIRTTQMLLESVGLVGVDIGTLQGQMVPRYVTPEMGLLDGSGAGIVQLLKESYGVEAHTISPAEFAPITHLAGQYPIALGGHGWNHWVAVRRFDGERLVLGNPAGSNGGRYGQPSLDRQEFENLGPFSAVVITGRSA